MAEANTNAGLDALWAYTRSLPPNEAYMDKKTHDINLAREVGFNTEHPATNEWLHQYANKVRQDAEEELLNVLERLHSESKSSHNYYLHAIVQIKSRNQK